eukprot:gene8493-4854_t
MLLLKASGVSEVLVVASANEHRAFAATGGVGGMVANMGLSCFPIHRSRWDDTKGLILIQSHTSAKAQDTLERVASTGSNYLALGGGGALLHFISAVDGWGQTLRAASIDVSCEKTDHHMMIDAVSYNPSLISQHWRCATIPWRSSLVTQI